MLIRVACTLLFCLSCFISTAQPPRLELTPGGFEPVTVQIPATPAEKLIELSKNWAAETNKRRRGYDITNVTANTVTVSAYKRNAFYYRNRGESYDFRIRYDMAFTFNNDSYAVAFRVVDIYAKDDNVQKTGLGNYFTSDGRLKEGFEEVEPSLEATVNSLVNSHYNFLINFR